jgi:hypothetical protein
MSKSNRLKIELVYAEVMRMHPNVKITLNYLKKRNGLLIAMDVGVQ